MLIAQAQDFVYIPTRHELCHSKGVRQTILMHTYKEVRPLERQCDLFSSFKTIMNTEVLNAELEKQRRLLSQRFALGRSQLDIPGGPLSITHVQNPDLLLDELAEAPDSDPRVQDERLPYWAWIWPSALALAKHVRASEGDLKDKQVLEIGCGLGVPGIAALAHTDQVTFSDYSEDALEFAAMNAKLNGARSPRTALVDWREPPEGLRADVILASDVAYETRFFDPLRKFFRQVLKPDGVIMLSEPCRNIASPFFKMLENDGWVFRYREEEVIHDDTWAQVRIYRIHR